MAPGDLGGAAHETVLLVRELTKVVHFLVHNLYLLAIVKDYFIGSQPADSGAATAPPLPGRATRFAMLDGAGPGSPEVQALFSLTTAP